MKTTISDLSGNPHPSTRIDILHVSGKFPYIIQENNSINVFHKFKNSYIITCSKQRLGQSSFKMSFKGIFYTEICLKLTAMLYFS